MSPLTLSHRHFTLRYVLIVSTCVLLGVGFVSYTAYQARFLLQGPQVAVSISPTTTVHTERVIAIEGDAHNITRMSLNGRQIYTDESGHFTEPIVLENGFTKATLRAEDRYGRTTVVTRSFVYAPEVVNEEEVVAILSDTQ